jgi:hypothetical protein
MTDNQNKKRSDRPSAEALQTYPATTPERRFFKGRGPEAMENARAFMDVVRGRPRKGTTATGTSARSLRLPDTAWAELERRAAELELPLHGLLRKLVAEFLYTQATVPPRKASGRTGAVRARQTRRSAARRRRRKG